MTQKNYYLGIPLEFRYLFPKNTNFSYKHYVKLGVAVNYRLSTKTSIEFYDNAMAQYANAISETFEKPDLFNAYIYPAYGLRFKLIKDIWLNMELHFPGFLVGNKVHPFIRKDFAFGMQLSVQVPLSKTIK